MCPLSSTNSERTCPLGFGEAPYRGVASAMATVAAGGGEVDDGGEVRQNSVHERSDGGGSLNSIHNEIGSLSK